MTNSPEKIEPKRGEIYWAELDPTRGAETNGPHPVLIISNNKMNDKAPIVLAIPMTSNVDAKTGPFNIPYENSDYTIFNDAVRTLASKYKGGFKNSGGVILCNQSRAITKERLVIRTGLMTNESIMNKVKSALTDSFGLNSCRSCGYPVSPLGIHCGTCGEVHKSKCKKCKRVFDIDFRYCPHCGKEVN